MIHFNDDAKTNTEINSGDLAQLCFQDSEGRRVEVGQFLGKKNLVLVITRGLVGSMNAAEEQESAGSICVYCSTQASRLIANYQEFCDRDAEVMLVFPVMRKEDANSVQRFSAHVQKTSTAKRVVIPFPLVVDLELEAVDRLGIRDDLSKPSTYILDKSGALRFAYVGKSLSDRPSVKALLAQLDAINAP